MDRTQERDEMAGVTDACLDAETLAAWADGGLSGAALEAVQMHVADCARCQALVGALGRIQAAVPPAEPARAARWWLTWLVPLTAAAVVTAVWLAVPREQNGPRIVSDQVASAPAVVTPEAAKEEAKDEANAKTQEPAPMFDRNAPLTSTDDAKKVETAELRRDTAPSEVDRLSKQSAASGVASPSAAPAAPVAGAGAAPPSAANTNTLDSAVSGRLRAEAFVNEIVSPDPAIRWRIAGANVQRSINGGATWEATPTGVSTDLIAGSAPSALVCWVVGRGGVVLLSTDGRNWRRLAFPELTDLSGVRARDARAASVSAADGRTFSTTDAGLTWVPRPLQDF